MSRCKLFFDSHGTWLWISIFLEKAFIKTLKGLFVNTFIIRTSIMNWYQSEFDQSLSERIFYRYLFKFYTFSVITSFFLSSSRKDEIYKSLKPNFELAMTNTTHDDLSFFIASLFWAAINEIYWPLGEKARKGVKTWSNRVRQITTLPPARSKEIGKIHLVDFVYLICGGTEIDKVSGLSI